MKAYVLKVGWRDLYQMEWHKRIFLSDDQLIRNIVRVHKLFPRLMTSIDIIDLHDRHASIYVLTEDNHGEIGYFLDRDKAYEAARDVIMEDPYWEEWNGHGFDVHEITRDQITDNEIDDYKYLVGIKKYPLNHAWCH